MKQLIALLMAVGMLGGALTGCGESTGDQVPTTEENVEVVEPILARDMVSVIEEKREPLIADASEFTEVTTKDGENYLMSTLTLKDSKTEIGVASVKMQKDSDLLSGVMVYQNMLPPDDFIRVILAEIGAEDADIQSVLDANEDMLEEKQDTSKTFQIKGYTVLTSKKYEESAMVMQQELYTFFMSLSET